MSLETESLRREIAELRDRLAAIANELSGVEITCSNITGDPLVDKIRSLRTKLANIPGVPVSGDLQAVGR